MLIVVRKVLWILVWDSFVGRIVHIENSLLYCLQNVQAVSLVKNLARDLV